MGPSLPFRLILASGSPARRDLLARVGYAFEILPSHIDEPNDADFPNARTLVAHIAWLKAAAVVAQVSATPDRPALVLSADTVGWFNGRVIGKPADESDARRILRLLSGTEHELWTGVCLWLRPGNLQVAWQEMSRVAMERLNDAGLDAYLATGVWRGASGAYAIQEEGQDPLVHVRAGSKTNVIGLPMESLEQAFRWLAGPRPPELP